MVHNIPSQKQENINIFLTALSYVIYSYRQKSNSNFTSFNQDLKAGFFCDTWSYSLVLCLDRPAIVQNITITHRMSEFKFQAPIHPHNIHSPGFPVDDTGPPRLQSCGLEANMRAPITHSAAIHQLGDINPLLADDCVSELYWLSWGPRNAHPRPQLPADSVNATSSQKRRGGQAQRNLC